jgi:putative membrane protein
MKVSAVVGCLIGAALSAWLLARFGVERIIDLLRHAGWFGLAVVIAFHLPQIVASALAWRSIAGPARGRPGFRGYLTLRWIREGVNNLLPVAQIGGEFIATRLLRRRGMPLATAIAGTVADLTMEMVTQIVFTLLGLALLLASVGDAGIATSVITGLGIAAVAASGFLAAQWLGMGWLIEHGLARLGRALGWRGTANVDGLHAALLSCYRAPRRVAGAALFHMIGWLLGGIEVCLALHFLGHDVGIVPGLVIESLGQALKSVGFAVPGALGVQEGGYILVCHAFGLAPELAIALSLMKRLREVVLGVPSLLAWQRMESAEAFERPRPISGALP